MTNNEEIRQPKTPSKTLANYLDMTAPRNRVPKQARPPRRRDERQRRARAPIDNQGLGLEEGNDLA